MALIIRDGFQISLVMSSKWDEKQNFLKISTVSAEPRVYLGIPFNSVTEIEISDPPPPPTHTHTDTHGRSCRDENF